MHSCNGGHRTRTYVGWGRADAEERDGRGHSGMVRGTWLSPATWVYHTEPGLDRVAAVYKRWGRPRQAHPLQLPNSRQLEPLVLSAPWWVPGQRCSSREQPVTGVEREEECCLWQHGKSIAFFISTAEYYYALCMAFMNVCLTIIYLPEINSLLSLQTSSQCHHLSSLQIN